ncbi:MAG: S24 family peptidase [Alphaproteobacteria bacterium]|nr:S24 family peptidase [Alphaproteobacteria bacterium]
MVVSSDIVDYVRRPEPLARVRDGYALHMVGESMVPAYEPGDLLLIHTHLPPARGTDVVLYGTDASGHEVVTVKRLVRLTDTDWHLMRHNPAAGESKEFKLPRKMWAKCHRVVGRYNRR